MTGSEVPAARRESHAIPGGAGESAVAEALRALASLGDRVSSPGALGALTTYRIGGQAAVSVRVTSENELRDVSAATAASGLPVLVVGKGSNLLVADAGFGGIAVSLGEPGFTFVEIDGTTVRAGAAVAMPVLARQTVEAGLTGFEWAVGVPGSVGGGVRMNAGGHGSDMSATLRSCRVADLSSGSGGNVRAVSLEDLRYRYRTSSLGPSDAVLSAEIGLARGDPAAGREVIREIVRWRHEHQPGGQNAGSVFTNPPGTAPADSAGWLIDAAGQKGRRLGSAMVSPKHANFIQADEGGSADDVLRLLELVRAEVARTTGVTLRTEVKLIGFDSQPQAEP